MKHFPPDPMASVADPDPDPDANQPGLISFLPATYQAQIRIRIKIIWILILTGRSLIDPRVDLY